MSDLDRENEVSVTITDPTNNKNVAVTTSNELKAVSTAQGSVAPGTVATTSVLTGGKYTATPPTLTDGQQVALQVDANGNLKTNATLSASAVQIKDVGGTIINPATSTTEGPVTPGTVATKSTLVGGQYNTTLPTLTAAQQAALQLDVSGKLLVNAGTVSTIPDSLSSKNFAVSISGVTASSSGSDNPQILIKNPNGSGKYLIIQDLYCGTQVANVSVLYKVFSTPTVTTNGTAITPVNLRIGSAVASVANAYYLPTVSSRGTQVEALVQGSNNGSITMSIKGQIVLPPNTTILVTADPLSNNRTSSYAITWTEEVV
jgi:hypothetical protein